MFNFFKLYVPVFGLQRLLLTSVWLHMSTFVTPRPKGGNRPDKRGEISRGGDGRREVRISSFLDCICNGLILGCFSVAVPTALPCTRVACRHRSSFSSRGTRLLV